MALTKFTADVQNVQALSDTPNATEGLTADQLKAIFDKAGEDLKAYINDTLTAEVDTTTLKASNNLSDIGTAATARTNLGLGTMAVEAAASYLPKSGNLSGLSSAATSRTNLGLGTASTKNITISTSDASGGSDGDIWIKYTA